LEILGVILLAAAIGSYLLKVLVMKTQGLLHVVASILAGVAGILMIVGCILFGTSYEKDNFSHNNMDLHAGFYLCVVAGVGSLVSAVLYIIDRDDHVKIVPCGGDTL
jgi:cytochrome bd-type quinol oxidase subunit 2